MNAKIRTIEFLRISLFCSILLSCFAGFPKASSAANITNVSGSISPKLCGGWAYRECSYSFNQPSSCTLSSSPTWELEVSTAGIYTLFVTGDKSNWISFPTYAANSSAPSSFKSCLNNNLWGTSGDVKQAYIRDINFIQYSKTVCPPARVTYSCQPTCTKKTWYLDKDGDGIGDSTKTTSSCTQPAGYSAASGDECDNVRGIYKKDLVCVDADYDGFPLNKTKVLACPAVDPGSNSVSQTPTPYTYCEEFSNGALDCNDNNPQIKAGELWGNDLDGDGYYDSKSTKYYCSAPRNSLKKVSTFKGSESCDNNPTLQKEVSYCQDKDGDGFGSSYIGDCGGFCNDNPTLNNNGFKFVKDLKENADCPWGGDNDAVLNPKSKWVIDCDGDGYYENKYVETTGCEEPKAPDYCANAIKAVSGRTTSTNTPIEPVKYTLMESVDGKKLQKGDCDDSNSDIKEIMFLFADNDNDGMGDPAVFKVATCYEDNSSTVTGQSTQMTPLNPINLTVSPTQTLIAANASATNWVRKPNDLDPQHKANDVADTINDFKLSGTVSPVFILTRNPPKYCIAQAATSTSNYCMQNGDICNYNPRLGNLACLSEALITAFCPNLIRPTPEDNYIDWYSSTDMPPYGTMRPIIEEADLNSAGNMSRIYNDKRFVDQCVQIGNVDLNKAMLIEVIGTDKTYLHFNQYSESESQKGYVLIDTNGSDYKIDIAGYLETLSFIVDPDKEDSDNDIDFQNMQTLQDAFNKSALSYWKYLYDDIKTIKISAAEFTKNFSNYNIYTKLSQIKTFTLNNEEYLAPVKINAGLRCVIQGYIMTMDHCRLTQQIDGYNTDADSDGVSDYVETALTPAGHNPVEAIFNANIVPKVVKNLILMQSSLNSYELSVLEEAKQRAHELVEFVFQRTLEVAGNNDEIELIINDMNDWHQAINIVVPSNILNFASDGKKPESWMALPIAAAYNKTVLGLNTCGKPCRTCESQMPHTSPCVYVDIFSIINTYDNHQHRVQQVATTILHEILHSHIYTGGFLNFQATANEDFEHELIYGITGEYFDFGCGTK